MKANKTHTMSGNAVLHLVVIAITTTMMMKTTNANNATPNITIACPDTNNGEHCSHIKYVTGYNLELTCHVAEQHAVSSIHWLYHNTTDINDLGWERMHYNGTNLTSTLVIGDIRTEDSGNYTCVTSLPDFAAQILIETYVMPDYFVAGMILLGLNLGLCLLFVVCLASSIITERRRKSASKYDGYSVKLADDEKE